MKASSASAATAGPSGYQALIHKATGAPRHLLGLLENIMRDEVFHSTLDWQSRADFDRGAKLAYALYRRDSAFYDASATIGAATFLLMRAETEFTQARAASDEAEISAASVRVESARADLAVAQVAFDRICAC